MADEIVARPRRRLRKRWIALVPIVVIGIVFLSLWSQRREIATGYIERELARRGVQAHYEITRFGVGLQRMENVRIGDPAHPDLTADWIELRIAYGLRYPRVARITARGVRLYGRIVDGKLSLGQIDKLLPPPTEAPFSLPDLNLDIADAAMRLDTPVGQIGLSLIGKGNLASGFRGRAIALARQLNVAGCTLQAPHAALAIAVAGRRPSLDGPVRSERLTCGEDVQVQAPLADLDVTLAQSIDAWEGNARVRSGALQAGADRLAALDGRLSLNGSAELTRGRLALAGVGGRFGDISGARLLFGGRYEASATRRQVRVDGEARATTLAVGDAMLRSIVASLRSTAGTPLEPFGEALAAALVRGNRNVDARMRLALAVGREETSLRVEDLEAQSRGGGRLTLWGGDGVTFAGGGTRVDGRFVLAGGGFPQVEAILRQEPGQPVTGTVFVRPYAVGAARLALAPVQFEGGVGGVTRVSTLARVDGPFSGGQVRALEVPISGWFGRGAFAFGERCTPLAFQSLSYGTLTLAPTRLRLCPVGRGIVWRAGSGPVRGGADIANLRLTGRLGSSPITYSSGRFRFDVADARFTSGKVAIRLGSPAYVNHLDFGELTGRFTARGVDGDFTGGAGKIANVPLLMSQVRGRWQLAGGRLGVDGSLVVADETDPSRFYPLRSDDFRLALADNRIDAGGWLRDPETGTRVTRATIRHDLDTGRGRADLDVPGIVFNDQYQPEQLTRLSLGVIALVDGELEGRGEIVWTPEATTSTGTFSTTGMDLAAPFGPVTGLTTTMNFTDLLGLVTAPDQQASVQRIQAGIDVFDGQIRYQLLPGLRVRVQSGVWPFAGGRLLLDETILDFSQASAKHLTFRVEGMDAAAFVEQMKFSNIAATGTFDGIVPMVFDERGGRIVDGYLAARPGGGTVSYIGELTEAELGAYGKLAFDALKSLRYNKLTVTLNGALDGEFVAGIELHGIAREAPSPGGIPGMALRQLAKIPFEFNIVARGPFRAIIGTMRSLKDPSGLIQQVLPPEIRDQPTSLNVQRKESETVPWQGRY